MVLTNGRRVLNSVLVSPALKPRINYANLQTMHWLLQGEDICRAGVERRGSLFHGSILKCEALVAKMLLTCNTHHGWWLPPLKKAAKWR